MTKRAPFFLGLLFLGAALVSVGEGSPQARGAQSLTRLEHDLLGTDPEQTGTYLDVAFSGYLRFQVSRTSAMEYLAWIEAAKVPAVRKSFVADAAGDGLPNLYRFGLDWDSPQVPFPIPNAVPEQVSVDVGNESFAGYTFVAKRQPRRNRVLYVLEAESEQGDWEEVDSPPASREPLGMGFERVTIRDRTPVQDENQRRLRLTMRYEPVPTIFAHYVSDANPGWGAMAYLMQPMPAFFRLFHDQPQRLEPVPKGPSDRFDSTGGIHRDWPLISPGFSFSTAIESAELEIQRAQRAGLDGFAVNCLGGKTDFLEALFAAAARRHRNGRDPFLLTLSIDINVLSCPDREMLPTVADLIRKWLSFGKNHGWEMHLARRGGMPLVMGYQSHWIWIDYLGRLLEHWQWEKINEEAWEDDRLRWPDSLGAAPDVPQLPPVVLEKYRSSFQARLDELKRAGDFKESDEYRKEAAYFQGEGLSPSEVEDRALQSFARRHARNEAARQWAREPDGWSYIRDAYDLVERLVGEDIFWQFDAVDIDAITDDPEAVLEVISRDFPAVNFFLPKNNSTALARRIVRESGAEWGEPIYAQYVAYGQNEHNGLFLGNVRGGDGTGTFRRSWYQALGMNLETHEALVDPECAAPDTRSSLIQYTTWNDYGEHSHLGPSLQMRYALTELNRHFTHTWKTGESLGVLGKQLFLFYRKYPSMSASACFPFRHAATATPGSFEVVAILNEDARLDLLGEDFARAEPRLLRRGFEVATYQGPGGSDLWREGPVLARVETLSGKTLTATGWEEVTHRPFRQDSTLVGASSRCDELWLEEAGALDLKDLAFAEYGDRDRDGLPNWFEMFYFGRGWLNLSDQVRASPDTDENRDGMTNLSHYQAGTNPTFFTTSAPYREDERRDLLPVKIGRGVRTRIETEDFDRGGAGVAYHTPTFETMQGGDYREMHYDLVSHRVVDAHEEDDGEWMVGPLANGQWMAYTIDIAPGCYRLSARVREGGGRIQVGLGKKKVLDAEIEQQGLWSTQVLGMIDVEREGAGERVLRLHYASPGFAINWIEFEPCPQRASRN